MTDEEHLKLGHLTHDCWKLGTLEKDEDGVKYYLAINEVNKSIKEVERMINDQKYGMSLTQYNKLLRLIREYGSWKECAGRWERNELMNKTIAKAYALADKKAVLLKARIDNLLKEVMG